MDIEIVRWALFQDTYRNMHFWVTDFRRTGKINLEKTEITDDIDPRNVLFFNYTNCIAHSEGAKILHIEIPYMKKGRAQGLCLFMLCSVQPIRILDASDLKEVIPTGLNDYSRIIVTFMLPTPF